MVRIVSKKLQPLSKWIEATVRLPVGLSAEPGPIKLAPYMRAIADVIGDPAVERVTVLKSARIGFTTVMSAAVAHFLVRDPCRVLTLWPTESDARGWVVSDLEPIFADSPALHDKLPMPHPGRSDRTTLLHRIGENGASLTVVGAGAPRNLRRHSARVLMVDEADACEVLSEGNPIALAVQRTLSFPDRKIVVGSTPLNEGTSHICRLYGQSDMRIWQMPCPACGTFAEIAWKDIEWPEGQPELAAWRCPSCRELVPETYKPKMLSRGCWRALRPEAEPGHLGFKINTLASLLPNASWAKLAAEFLRAKDDSDTLRVFVNTVLAEPWHDQADEADEADLAGRAEPFDLDHVPPEVAFCTVGGDCQDNRVELSILGHARDGTTFVLAHIVVWGSPLEEGTWQEVDDVLKQRWRHPNGGVIKVDAAAIDSGGSAGVHDVVLGFCAARTPRRVFAVKGASGFGRPAIQRARTRGRPLFIAGVDALKSQIIGRLARGRSIRFSHTLTGDYFEQLASERKVTRMSRGRPVIRFERKFGAKAEALDCMAYGLSARAALSLNAAAFEAREGELRLAAPKETPPPVVIKSRWMERGRERW